MKNLLIISALCLFSSCNDTNYCLEEESLDENDRILIKRESKQMLKDYFASVKTKGLLGEFPYLDSSADFYWVPPGFEHPISYDSVATILRSRASSFKEIDNSFDTLTVFPLTNNLASYTGRINSICTDTSGTTRVYKLMETGMLVRRENAWKLLSGQTSLISKAGH
jgi:hypothetical protein